MLTNFLDCDSEEEDQILAYINRRDNPDSHPSSPEPEHESYNSQEETTEVSEEQGADQSSRIYSPEKGTKLSTIALIWHLLLPYII